MKTVTLVCEDRPSLLSDISYILGSSHVNVEGMAIEVVDRRAVIALQVKNSDKATEVLHRNGFETINHGSLIVKANKEVDHESLEQVRAKLLTQGIKIEDHSLLCGNGESEIFAIHVNKPRKAIRTLKEAVLNRAMF